MPAGNDRTVERQPSPSEDAHATAGPGEGQRTEGSEAAEGERVGEVELPSDLAQPVRRAMTWMMGQMTRLGPVPSPLTEKITPEHIPLIIESNDKETQLGFQDAQERRKYSLIYCGVAVLLFVFLVWFLSASNPDLLERLIGHLVVLAGGFLGGFGYRSWRERSN